MGNGDEAAGLPHVSPFEAIRREAEDGSEYWSARDLARILGYTQYNKFKNAIEKAEEACQNSGQAVSDHFTHVSELIEVGKGAKRKFDTVYLSRYGCYLIVQNADPSKPIVALEQTYFAVQTRLALGAEMSIYNSQLAEAAKGAGVVETKDFAIYQQTSRRYYA